MSIQHLHDLLQLTARHPRLWIPAGVVGLWLAVKLWRGLFGSWGGFLEALRYSHQPGWLSLLRGELGEDLKAEAKLLFWGVVMLVVLLGLKIGLTKLMIAFALVQRFHLPV